MIVSHSAVWDVTPHARMPCLVLGGYPKQCLPHPTLLHHNTLLLLLPPSLHFTPYIQLRPARHRLSEGPFQPGTPVQANDKHVLRTVVQLLESSTTNIAKKRRNAWPVEKAKSSPSPPARGNPLSELRPPYGDKRLGLSVGIFIVDSFSQWKKKQTGEAKDGRPLFTS